MARQLSCPIVPIGFDASRKKVFASWDRFHLPYPFSRIAIVFGEPVVLEPTADVDAACRKVKAALDAATSHAADLVS